MSDYTYQHTFETRSAELQDIAAMDRLAGQLAPAPRLRRYAETSGLADRRGWGAEIRALVRHARHAA